MSEGSQAAYRTLRTAAGEEGGGGGGCCAALGHSNFPWLYELVLQHIGILEECVPPTPSSPSIALLIVRDGAMRCGIGMPKRLRALTAYTLRACVRRRRRQE